MKKEIRKNGTVVLISDGGWIVNADHSICTDFEVWLSKFDKEENYTEITNEEKEQWDDEHKIEHLAEVPDEENKEE